MPQEQDTIRQALQRVLVNTENVRLEEVQKVVIDAFAQRKFETVFKFYERLRRVRPELARVLRDAIAWTGYRRLQNKKLETVFAQPVLLKYTALDAEEVPEVPAGDLCEALKDVYGVEHVATHGVLLTPSAVNTYNPVVAWLLPAHPVRTPIKPHQLGWHLRFWPVRAVASLPFDGVKFEQEGLGRIGQLLSQHTKASDYAVLKPVEVFDLWAVYDTLNALSKKLDDEGGRRD